MTITVSSGARVVQRVAELRAALAEPRRRGVAVALVPTMGFLHEGHLRLVDEARRRAAFVVMSIFVNPLQFGPHDDFARYPRNLENDVRLASARGVDLIFAPPADEMYHGELAASVTPRRRSPTAGRARCAPGTSAACSRWSTKLFNLVQPQVAIFGQKDIQQATIVRRDGARPRFPDRVRRRADGARGRRPRALEPQRLPVRRRPAARPRALARAARRGRRLRRRRARRDGARDARLRCARPTNRW